MSFQDSLFAEWRAADRAATAIETTNARASIDAVAGRGPPPSTGQRLKAAALRGVADDLYQVAMGLMKERAEHNARA